jgi:glycosylphosphatidylinositol deacylase
MPSVDESLANYNSMAFRYFAPASLLLAVIPLPESLYLGNNGTLFLAPIAPIILTISGGLVNITWALLLLLQKAIGRPALWFSGRFASLQIFNEK